MIHTRLHPLACLCAALVLLPSGCQITLPIHRQLLNGPPARVPGPLSSAMTPPLRVAIPEGQEETSRADNQEGSELTRTSYQEKKDEQPTEQALPLGMKLADAEAAAVSMQNSVPVNLDIVLRLTFDQNGEIQVARERVNESQVAFDAALRSCMPEMMRKDTFKKPVAEAQLWRRRAELRKVENDNLQDAANTYFDLLTALRGEAITRDLLNYDERLLSRARKMIEAKINTANVLVEAAEAVVEGRRQFLARTHQQGEAAAAKLAYLMGLNGPTPVPKEMLEPIDRVDTSAAGEVLVRQAQDNGPGVRELQGLAASIQNGIDSARFAQCICAHTGSPLVCGRLQMAQSELRQAQLSLFSLQTKLRAGVEEAVSAILSGREQIARATVSIRHAAEAYSITDKRLHSEDPQENMRNNTFNAMLTSIQQLNQAHANYLTAVSNYNKAQTRLLLLLGTYSACPQN
jgi:hypothetical protein